MTIASLCSKNIISIPKDASLYEAARLMKESNIGAIVVVDNKDQYPIPCGILTDRDLVVQLMIDDIDLHTIKVGDIMSADLFAVYENQGIKEVIMLMTQKKVRRAPVVNNDGRLVGIVTSDDLLILLAQELKDLADLIARQIHKQD